jgi:hypothetical protein
MVLLNGLLKEFLMRFTATSGGVPADIYEVEFANIEPFESDAGAQFGPAVTLSFRIVSGEYEDQIASRICSQKFSPKAALRQFAEAICGHELSPNEQFDFTDHFGVAGRAVVQEIESGATRVDAFVKAK